VYLGALYAFNKIDYYLLKKKKNFAVSGMHDRKTFPSFFIFIFYFSQYIWAMYIEKFILLKAPSLTLEEAYSIPKPVKRLPQIDNMIP
jgi:hypothetical protein